MSGMADKDEVLARYMAQHGLKSTRQRSHHRHLLRGWAGHLPVEDLWTQVRQQDPRVSVATVYRTMKLLSDCGLAHARNFGDGQTRYEAAVGRTTTITSSAPAAAPIVEFENDRIEAMQDAVARKHGFTVTSHKMELYGLCRDCQRRGRARAEARSVRRWPPLAASWRWLASRCARRAPRRREIDVLGRARLPRPGAAAARRARSSQGQVVLVNFFATWCFPCLAAAAHARGAPEGARARRACRSWPWGWIWRGAQVLGPSPSSTRCPSRCWSPDEHIRSGQSAVRAHRRAAHLVHARSAGAGGWPRGRAAAEPWPRLREGSRATQPLSRNRSATGLEQFSCGGRRRWYRSARHDGASKAPGGGASVLAGVLVRRLGGGRPGLSPLPRAARRRWRRSSSATARSPSRTSALTARDRGAAQRPRGPRARRARGARLRQAGRESSSTWSEPMSALRLASR